MSVQKYSAYLAPVIAAGLLFLILIQPNHPGAMTWGALRVLPLELPAILLAVMALGSSLVGAVFRVVLTVCLTVIATLKVADFVTFNTLSRGFNPVADLPLITAAVRLVTGSVGPLLASVAVMLAGLAVFLIAAALWWSLRVWSRLPLPIIHPWGVGLAALAAMALVVADTGHVMRAWTLPSNPPGTAFTARVGAERVITVRDTLAQLRAFRSEIRNDPFAGRTGLFDALDRDALVIFIESYGRTSFDRALYADLHRETLARYNACLMDLGLITRSGFLVSPTKGGQSWLAHATLANGMWIDNQISYAAALTSGRETLFHHASRNGLRTATVMPQITLDWPEADRMGFDLVLAEKDLGYRGLPFNWVTMPDQYTLSALDRLVRNELGTIPQVVQVALASSHAPWVPVPDVIPWEEVGDGTAFNEVAVSGDAPDVVWRDRDRIRQQYKLAVDYSLQAVMEYAVLHAGDPPLMIVVGDHQAAEFVAQDNRSDVPIHIIGPAHLVGRLEAIAPYAGLLPDDNAVALPMDQVRDHVLSALTTTTTTEVAE